MKLSKIKNVHFTGIKGVGLTSLALCAQDFGAKVTGSDVKENFVTEKILNKRNITPRAGFSSDHVPTNTDLLIYTGAHGGPNNPEVVTAISRKVPTLSHAQAVGLLMEGKTGISICGVGGKSTTSAMLAHILEHANLMPSFTVGVGNITSLGVSGKFNKNGKYFVAEADEYFASPGIDDTPKFFYQTPNIIIATNIAFDHPDVYKNFEETKKAYLKFFDKLPNDGSLIAFADNPDTLKLAKKSQKNLITYGENPDAQWKLKNFHSTAQKSLFTITYQEMDFKYSLPVPGKFNALNSIAAVAAAVSLGVDQRTCIAALYTFTGTMRRFEKVGTKKDIFVYDDYAHHPSEIKATLIAAKNFFPEKKIYAIFQPHTYSRTKALFSEFAKSFTKADHALFLPIYASAREEKDLSVSSELLSRETSKSHPNSHFFSTTDSLLKYLNKNITPNSLILTLGAGDIYKIGQVILKNL